MLLEGITDRVKIIYSTKTKKYAHVLHATGTRVCEAFISWCGIKECLSSSQHARPLVALTITVPHEALVKLGKELLESCHNTHVF